MERLGGQLQVVAGPATCVQHLLRWPNVEASDHVAIALFSEGGADSVQFRLTHPTSLSYRTTESHVRQKSDSITDWHW